ncbi:antileukoproteinase [Oryctolagus cuniculus]|uniref:antileukoproteinase n=1 Tax=Oryctolagus cuniculus TaxID=9986 RepID=UPI00048ED0A4|nr:antileukoproteinase [Oryctolagus cuniculus]
MRSSVLFPIVVLVVLGSMATWAVEGVDNGEKPGNCPLVEFQCLMLNPPNLCETDSQCKDNLKCCQGSCGKACFLPV